jgi:hypothetical protein
MALIFVLMVGQHHLQTPSFVDVIGHFFDLCNNALWISEVGSGCVEILNAEISRCDASG